MPIPLVVGSNMNYSIDGTYFQFQHGLCICMESAIVQLRLRSHQIWPLYDL